MASKQILTCEEEKEEADVYAARVDSNERRCPDKKEISIIIPSKDHPELLKRCILSLAAEAGLEYDKEYEKKYEKECEKKHEKECEGEFRKKYEMIIVDNGSRQETKEELEGAKGKVQKQADEIKKQAKALEEKEKKIKELENLLKGKDH